MTSWTFFDGQWIEGNPGIIGPHSIGFWLGSMVFDGARAFEGVAPDLDRHCQRVVASAKTMGLGPMLTGPEIEAIGRDGLKRFPKDAQLYIRPMFWAESGHVEPDPASTRFCFTLYDQPMPEFKGSAVMKSSYCRPLPQSAPTDAKAGCLYPNSARALKEAHAKGFDNAVVLDALGNVAELATANLFFAKDGVVVTPAINGCFLNGITRQRTIKLLREAGIAVEERRVTYDELLGADELASVGNYGKIMPITRIEERALQPGPITQKARKLYWDWAHS